MADSHENWWRICQLKSGQLFHFSHPHKAQGEFLTSCVLFVWMFNGFFSFFFGVGFYDGQLMSELNMWMNATKLGNGGTITCTGLPLLCSHFCSEWYTVCALAAVVRAERRGWCWRSRGIPRNSTVIIRCSVILSHLRLSPSLPPSLVLYLSIYLSISAHWTST